MKIEYRTQALEPAVLLEELAFFCQATAVEGNGAAIVMLGWDCNLNIEEMWQDIPMSLDAVVDFVLAAERAGTLVIGKSDVFVDSGGLQLTLCHESDVHIEGEEAAAQPFLERWTGKGFAPYALPTNSLNSNGSSKAGDSTSPGSSD
ncbi:hypothetical protein LK542_05990 [Massilia sp. IC2-477]|uniref:hypothetical protein n=1 Tax=Massilia sp. IC2-477 TaxID=2887198 RepID=UPI001D1259C7|nr:hypothetical protein [Massilia sp. IC2-477]MCC2955168.1 hypothetical protein [Massilia sp. IC2-477]